MADRLLARIEAQAGAFNSLSSLAKVRISHPERNINATQVLFVQKPDRFRAEVLSPFGNPLLMTAANGRQLDAYIPSKGTFYRGAPDLENLQRFIPIPLRLTDLVHILLYDPLMIDFQTRNAVLEGAGYRLDLLADNGVRQALLFDDELQFQIEYDNFTESSPAFPLSIEIDMPLNRTAVSLSFRDAEINPEIPENRFSLVPPDGVRVEPFP
jgi:outer membrane lipoprotein-sorting protein